MNHLEKKHILNNCNPYFDRIKKYRRYVDDTFVIFRGTKKVVDTMLKYMNSISPSIQFTVEHMIDNSINFLDLTVYYDEENKLRFKIYRKPTATDLLIPFTSNHPVQHKLAAIHSLARRAFNIPMHDNDLQNEINVIYQLSHNNNFPIHVTKRVLEQQKAKLNPTECSQAHKEKNKNLKKSKYVSLTYFNKSSEKVGRVLNKYGYKTAFRTVAKAKNTILHSHNTADKLEKSGVYKINCSSCPALYIGKTERSIKTPFNDHLCKPNSNVYKHIETEHHVINCIHKCFSMSYIQQS